MSPQNFAQDFKICAKVSNFLQIWSHWLLWHASYVLLPFSRGLDYSNVIFASAKFRAAAKIEKTSTATCLFLVKNLGNFLNIFNTNYRSKLQTELYKEEFEQGLGRHHKAKSRIFYSPPILALNHYWKEHNFFFIFVFSTLVSMF